MSFDGLFIHAMVNEFNQTITGGKIGKINQPYKNDIIMTIRSHHHNYRLLLSSNPNFARAQITTIPYTNPPVPTNFNMTLRKYLNGGVLKQVNQINNDRIIHFHFTTRNEIGDIEDLVLVVEIMARHSNIILIDNKSKRIIDAIRRIGPDKNRYRSILPGVQYINPPKQDQISPFKFDDFKQIKHLMHEYPNRDVLAHALQKTIQGIGRDTAKYLADYLHRSNKVGENFYQFFHHYDDPEPTLTIENNKTEFMVYPFDQNQNAKIIQFKTLSALLDYYYRDKTERERVKERGSALIKVVKNELKKNRKKTKKLNKTLKNAQHADEYRVKGEILTTYLNKVKSGMKTIKLPNFYNDQKLITIKLSVKASPSENSQWYFKQYRKKQHAQKYVTQQLEDTKQEIDYFSNIRAQIDIANPDDLDEIKAELQNEGYIKKQHRKKNRNRKRHSHPEHFKSDTGITILVGKNNMQNDKLTMKTANKNDIWMHTQKIHGSHVIIRSDAPDQATLLQAASLAAYFSKGRSSSNVPVDYVPVKNLSKPNGAKPGFVIYRHQRTIDITPKESEVNKLRKNEEQK